MLSRSASLELGFPSSPLWPLLTAGTATQPGNRIGFGHGKQPTHLSPRHRVPYPIKILQYPSGCSPSRCVCQGVAELEGLVRTIQ